MCDTRHTKVPVLHSPALWGWLKSDSGNPFGLNYQRRPLHATNLYTADAKRAAGVSANDVRRIYSAQNSANIAEHWGQRAVAEGVLPLHCPFIIACRFIVSVSIVFVHDAHYDYVVM